MHSANELEALRSEKLTEAPLHLWAQSDPCVTSGPNLPEIAHSCVACTIPLQHEADSRQHTPKTRCEASWAEGKQNGEYNDEHLKGFPCFSSAFIAE